MKTNSWVATILIAIALLLTNAAGATTVPTNSKIIVRGNVVHPSVGISAKSDDGQVSITLVRQKHNFGYASENVDVDTDIFSPKSVNIHPDGTKYYVNSLEGSKTVVYDLATHKKLKVIEHSFTQKDSALWAKPSGFYKFIHYEMNNACSGKPVEAAFSHNGRYLWVPYYHRSYDINSQDPSAIAVIDTKADKIIRLFETGPLPKMVACSNHNNQIAISHWGDNTVGLIDASSNDPQQWHHKQMYVIDKQLTLNFSTTVQVNRDNGSGNALRGTVFTPDDRYLLVSCMGGMGGIAVVDMQQDRFIGRVVGMDCNIRHMVIKNNWLYLSINATGQVQRIPLDTLLNGVRKLGAQQMVVVRGWERCAVGTGARTIEMSPSGKYVFAACNNANHLAVVDTRTMTLLTTIPCDSYPVGLAVSPDGKVVIVTSQARNHGGGNAVNIYNVTYADDEAAYATYPAATDDDVATENADSVEPSQDGVPFYLYLLAGLAVIVIGIIIFLRKKK